MENKKFCEDCRNAVPEEDGGLWCDEYDLQVLNQFGPTEDYMYCNGEDYEESI